MADFLLDSILTGNVTEFLAALKKSQPKATGSLIVPFLGKITSDQLLDLYNWTKEFGPYSLTLEELRDLFKTGFKVDHRFEDGSTLAHKYSSKWCYYEHLKLICEKGANLTIRNDSGLTPYECFLNCKDLSKLDTSPYLNLFRKYEEFDLIEEYVRRFELGLSEEETLEDNIEKLSTSQLKRLIKAGFRIDTIFRNGCTLTHFYAALGMPEHLEILVKAGANINIKNESDRTPLKNLVFLSPLNSDRMRCLEILNRAVSDKILKSFQEDPMDISPKQLREMLDSGIDPNMIHPNGKTFAHIFSFLGMPLHLKMILKYKPNTGIRDENGKTALETLIAQDFIYQKECIELLANYEGKDYEDILIEKYETSKDPKIVSGILERLTPEQLERLLKAGYGEHTTAIELFRYYKGYGNLGHINAILSVGNFSKKDNLSVLRKFLDRVRNHKF